jgi:hypothetical protein
MDNENKDIELGQYSSDGKAMEKDESQVQNNYSEDIESEEERAPNRVVNKKVSIKMNEKKEYFDDKIPEVVQNSRPTQIQVEANLPTNKSPIEESIIIKTIHDPEESQFLNANQNEFDNMLLDVDKELLVSENEYSGNIDLSNKEMTRKVIISKISFSLK